MISATPSSNIFWLYPERRKGHKKREEYDKRRRYDDHTEALERARRKIERLREQRTVPYSQRSPSGDYPRRKNRDEIRKIYDRYEDDYDRYDDFDRDEQRRKKYYMRRI
ncbi:hypothetical protein FACS189472_12780 [Alphaproteobacteria bacterium]|nr:hypothetical protein FACS189472_12780 [Alphaproteobacteria bacterium]